MPDIGHKPGDHVIDCTARQSARIGGSAICTHSAKSVQKIGSEMALRHDDQLITAAHPYVGTFERGILYDAPRCTVSFGIINERRVRPTLHDYATIPLFRALPRGDLNVGALVGCCFHCKKLQVCALPYRDRPSQSHHNCMPMVLLTTERTYSTCRF